MIMKHTILSYTCLMLLSMGCLLSSCNDESPLTPSGNDTNKMLPADDDHSAEAELRRTFFNETGIYLFFNDTIRTEQNGTDINGKPVYNYEIIDFDYNLTGSSNAYDVTCTYYETIEEMQLAAELIKEEMFSHFLPEQLPYSILPFKKMTEMSWGVEVEKSTMSNTYCMGINTGDVLNMTLEEGKAKIKSVVKDLVEQNVNDLNYDDYQGPFYEVVAGMEFAYCVDVIPGWDGTQVEEVYKLGFLEFYPGGYDPSWDMLPYSDWTSFFNWVMDYPEEDFMAQYGQYEKCVQRYNIVKEAVLATGYKF